MGARRVDRETAESVAVIAGIGTFPEQGDYGMRITRIRYGSVAGDAWPSQSSRAASGPLIPLGLLAAAVVIIFALLRMVTRESSLYLSMHREREDVDHYGELGNRDDLYAPLVHRCPGGTVAQLWGE